MTARFVANSEIATRRAPFGTVGQDPPASGAKLRQEMGQFVPKSAIDLGYAVFAQSRIQRNKFSPRISASRASF
jgi:hypothetical protein